MIAFFIEDMSCAHCEATLRRALTALDPGAELHIDVASRQLRMGSTRVDAKGVEEAIRKAGYTPSPA